MVTGDVYQQRAQEERTRKREEKAHRKRERQERLAQEAQELPLRTAVTDAYSCCRYRRCLQGHKMRVAIASDPGVHCSTAEGGKYKRSVWRLGLSEHVIIVRPNWLSRVHSRGLATWKDQLVLDAIFLGATGAGQSVLDLTVLRQSRGTSLSPETARVVGSWSTWQPYRGAAITMPVESIPPGIIADWLNDHGSTHESEILLEK